MKITITIETLREHGACGDQQKLFAATFPKGAHVNSRNLAKAVKAGLQITWLERLIPSGKRTEYDRVCAPARTEYDRVCAPALAEYYRVCALARTEYDRVCALARTEYDRVCAPALVVAFNGKE